MQWLLFLVRGIDDLQHGWGIAGAARGTSLFTDDRDDEFCGRLGYGAFERDPMGRGFMGVLVPRRPVIQNTNGDPMWSNPINSARERALLILVSLSLAVAGCGGGEEESEPGETPTIVLPDENADTRDMGSPDNNNAQADQGESMDMGTTSSEDMTPTEDMASMVTDMNGTMEPPPPAPGDMLDASCAQAYDCGGRYYGQERDEYIEGCRTASTNYWGDCPRRLALIDAFGECSLKLTCEQINNGAGFVPNEEKCGAEYNALRSSEPCD